MGLSEDPLVPRFVPVTSARRETHDVVTLALDASSWPDGFAFEPGQFNMLYVLGVGESAISLSGDPSRRDRIVHTIRAVGPVTRKLDALKRGSQVGVRGPYGIPWPVSEVGEHAIVMAGGLGLAPLRPALYELVRRKKRVTLLYGARAPEEVVFARELERWRESMDVHVTVDRAGRDWQGNVGVVTALLARVEVGPGATAFVCGPEVMMRFSGRALEERGLPAARIHLSMERNMKCAVGFCGHCQLGPEFVCKDGPVFPLERIGPLMATREL